MALIPLVAVADSQEAVKRMEELGMRNNRHDIWQAFCFTQRELIAQTGLPAAVTISGQRFRDFLSEGQALASEATITLLELPPSRWEALYHFATVFFREFESFAPEDRFPAFFAEAQKRGSKFPR